MSTPTPCGGRQKRACTAAPPLLLLLLLLIALVLPSACITPGRHRVDVFVAEPAALRSTTWEVGAVDIDHRSLEGQIRAQLTEMLLPAFRGRGLPLEEGNSGGAGCRVEFRIAEREIARDLDAVNALSLALVIREKATGRCAASILYSEESRETFTSPYHLHAVLDVVLEALEKETGLRDGPRDGRRAGRS